jgi:hypothetical protein
VVYSLFSWSTCDVLHWQPTFSTIFIGFLHRQQPPSHPPHCSTFPRSLHPSALLAVYCYTDHCKTSMTIFQYRLHRLSTSPTTAVPSSSHCSTFPRSLHPSALLAGYCYTDHCTTSTTIFQYRLHWLSTSPTTAVPSSSYCSTFPRSLHPPTLLAGYCYTTIVRHPRPSFSTGFIDFLHRQQPPSHPPHTVLHSRGHFTL